VGDTLDDRLIELEIRSEEQRAEIARLEAFLRGYEARVAGLERDLAELRAALRTGAEPLPLPDDEKPPHY
jgi:uncharacterized coiled-coil protein SlyX